MASVKELTSHFPLFGHNTLWCGTATRPDCYEQPHSSLSLVISSFGFYSDYTRYAAGKLQLSFDGVTL